MNQFRPRLTVAIVTFLIYGYFCGGYISNVSNNAISDLTLAMVDDHSLRIDKYAGNSNDISEKDGSFYSGFGPGLSFLMVPVYLLLKPGLALVPSAVMAHADAALSARIAAKHSTLKSTTSRTRVLLLIVASTLTIAAPLGMLTTLQIIRTCRLLFPKLGDDDVVLLAFIAAFGTILTAFSIQLAHTAVAACLVWLAVARSIRAPDGASTASLVGNGVLLAAASCVDYPAAIYAGYAAVFTLVIASARARIRVAILGIVGAVPPILACLSYHRAAFGSALTNSYRFRARSVDRSIFDVHHAGTSLPNAEKLYTAFLHPYSGLVWYFPLLLVVLFVAGYFLCVETSPRLRSIWGLAVVTIATNIGIYCSYPTAVGPSSGPIFAVRYLMYSLPFTMLAFAALLTRLRSGSPARRTLLALAAVNAIPVWAVAFYGLPVFPARGYRALLEKVGPGNYTLTKLHESGILHSSLWAWFGALLIGALLRFWWRAMARLVRQLPVRASGVGVK